MDLEVKAIHYGTGNLTLPPHRCWGVFTLGVTLSNLYGAKISLERVMPGGMCHGLRGHPVAGVVSAAAHYSNRTIVRWLGFGMENLAAVPPDEILAMRLDLLRERLHQLHQDGVRVAIVIATFGTTDAFGVDDIAGIRSVIDEEAARAGQPVPQLSFDAAVGWVLTPGDNRSEDHLVGPAQGPQRQTSLRGCAIVIPFGQVVRSLRGGNPPPVQQTRIGHGRHDRCLPQLHQKRRVLSARP